MGDVPVLKPREVAAILAGLGFRSSPSARFAPPIPPSGWARYDGPVSPEPRHLAGSSPCYRPRHRHGCSRARRQSLDHKGCRWPRLDPPNALPFSSGRPSTADRQLQWLVGQHLGTTGVDPLQVSGDIVYTWDAMDRNECTNGTRTVRTRFRLGRLDDERVV